MPDLDDPATFRLWATRVRRASLVVLVALALGCAGIGYLFAGVWGLVIGGIIGHVVAFGGLVAVSLLWAMSQDGA
jgi:hypothetical protein